MSFLFFLVILLELSISRVKASGWTLMSPIGNYPVNNSDGSGVLWLNSREYFFFGGNQQDSIFVYFVSKQLWSSTVVNSLSAPSLRSGHTMVNYQDKSFYLYGGRIYSNNNLDTGIYQFYFANYTWSIAYSPTILSLGDPPARYGHTSVVYGDGMYVFGGFKSDNSPLNSFAVFSFTNNKWSGSNSYVPNKPTGRGYHTAIIYNETMYTFGGLTVDSSNNLLYLNEVLYCNFSSFICTSFSTFGQLPTPRASHSAVITSNGNMIIFGGRDEYNFYNDIYILNLEYDSWSLFVFDSSVPSVAKHVAFLFLDTMFVIGGEAFGAYQNEILEYSLLSIDTTAEVIFQASTAQNAFLNTTGINQMDVGFIVGTIIFVLLIICVLCIVLIVILSVKRRKYKRNSEIITEEPEQEMKEIELVTQISPSSVKERRRKRLSNTLSAEFLHSITVKEKLGSGNFGEVYLGMWSQTKVALKKFKDTNHYKEVLREIEVLRNLNHPNIVKMYGIYQNPNEGVFIVMEFMEQGSLEELIASKYEDILLTDLIDFAHQAALGMIYLGEMNIVHRDLALRNLLVSVVGESTAYIVKITDFGLSRTAESGYYISKSNETKFPIKWSAPEVYEKHQSSTKSDVWSFGILLYEMLTYGKKPYIGMSNEEVMQQVPKGYRLTIPENAPPQLSEIMRKSWDYSPNQRPTFQDILSVLNRIKSDFTPQPLITNIQLSNTKPKKDEDAIYHNV